MDDVITLTRPPRTLSETGLPEDLIRELLLKHLYDGGMLDIHQLHNRLKLPGAVLEPILDKLRKNQRVLANTPLESSVAVRYQLTELGMADASNILLKSGYLGPAPITLEHYRSLVAAQSIFHSTITREKIKKAFERVVIDENHLDVLGPALHSGRPILIYGQAGTGKTYICKKMSALLGGSVYLPYAIVVGREIIQYFDPLVHSPIDTEANNSLVKFHEASDPRLLHCHRPVAISGGELTMDRLEIKYDPTVRISYAPIQMKTNNGIYIIDDMGRQRMQPTELFNRWIIPMEERVDYLTLSTGLHFSVPFDSVLIFSTNMHPLDLADEAFLRRLGYKIHFTPITKEQFTQIWQDLADQRKVTVEEGVLPDILDRFRTTGRDLLPCHPRDLMEIALDIGAYLNNAGTVTQRTVMLAWDTYFVNLKEG
jgi:predicted ATPase with chaperone activity